MPSIARLLVLAALVAACEERERLTFPSNDPGDDNIAPFTTIERPGNDTVLTEGAPFLLSGRSVDTTGVDTVYFDVAGADVSYAPLAAGGVDTVTFALQIPTLGRSGQIITVSARAVDMQGNRGGASTRHLTIQ